MKLSYVQCSNICCLKMQKKEDFYHTLIFRWAKNKKKSKHCCLNMLLIRKHTQLNHDFNFKVCLSHL